MDRTFTYRRMGDLVNRAVKGFQQMGVGKGTRVGLFLPNCPYFVIAYFAALKAGATVVNFNPLYAERELAKQIEDRSEEHTSELQSLMRISYAVFCLKKKKN